MRTTFISTWLTLLTASTMALAGSIGCAGASGGGTVASCTAGATESCSCASGASGAQTCNADGTGFGGCECDDPVDAGPEKDSAEPDSAPPPDAAPPEDSAPPGPSCPISFSNSTCETCFQASCGSACGACAGDTECEGALTCYANCTTSSCASSCLSGLSTTTTNLLGAMFSDPSGCIYASCRAQCTTPAANGDPCLVGADCTSGECDSDGVHGGWCTVKGCTSNPQCGVDTAGELVWCGEVSGGGYECFPGCSSDADCTAFYCDSTASAATCGSDTSVNGYAGNICGCW